MTEFDKQVLRLTDKFYKDYPEKEFPEILKKKERPYNCLLVQTHYGYFICIPFRTEIHHEYAYKFTNSNRSKVHSSGLDYSKIIIIKNPEYIDSENALVDRDEYKEIMINLRKIVRDATQYVDDYIAYKKGELFLHPKEYRRRYLYTTLKYFHNELEIE